MDEELTDLVAQRVREALDAREFIHAESSRIYARLAGAVRAGADDATLAKLLRAEVDARAISTYRTTPSDRTNQFD